MKRDVWPERETVSIIKLAVQACPRCGRPVNDDLHHIGRQLKIDDALNHYFSCGTCKARLFVEQVDATITLKIHRSIADRTLERLKR